MVKYNTEIYRGFKVFFRPLGIRDFKIGAQVPQITSHYLGAGRTKAQAFNKAKREIDKHIYRRGRR